ncbi:aspartate 1-decarboxylase [Xanthomonas citri pv. mangiferaeindicae LMG 941]|uniref:aspartate 1-decarboxylase n=1 Tax=Xanthomonas citri TaxID=346 RepID=UPI000255292F|nr:aspartate 1-decarboxylase [Xanthomonas citri]CCG36452.1 aspartate 1-decarboxylase [Xanthomonas citri pv. mangiferaeindicae LMG 941]
MTITMLQAKIHRATVTHAELNYEGSIAIDSDLLEASGIHEYEQMHAWNINSGQRFVTYALQAEAGSGIISINGSAARSVQVGDLIIIAAFTSVALPVPDAFRPSLVFVDARNGLTHKRYAIPTQMRDDAPVPAEADDFDGL